MPQASMAELPAEKRARYSSLGLPLADVLILADELATADFFDATLAAGADAKQAANWIMGDIMAACKVGCRHWQEDLCCWRVALLDLSGFMARSSCWRWPDMLLT